MHVDVLQRVYAYACQIVLLCCVYHDLVYHCRAPVDDRLTRVAKPCHVTTRHPVSTQTNQN